MTSNPKITPEALLDLIGEFGREVFNLLDDCETTDEHGEEVHTITNEGLDKVSGLLDQIDALPFEEPGCILGTGAMLQVAIQQTFFDAAWNDAIEAAGNLESIHGYSNAVPRHRIRALRRAAPVPSDGLREAVALLMNTPFEPSLAYHVKLVCEAIGRKLDADGTEEDPRKIAGEARNTPES